MSIVGSGKTVASTLETLADEAVVDDQPSSAHPAGLTISSGRPRHPTARSR